MFNTLDAHCILEALQVFPLDNPWNEDVPQLPLHPNSANAAATTDGNRHLYYNAGMGFIIVPPGRKRAPVKITDYPDESDPGPFPIPDNAPIEGWPLYPGHQGKSLAGVQREGAGDRRVIVLDPWNGMLYELFHAFRDGNGGRASCAVTFDLKTNKLRPDGWTSADAAGLPIFPATVRCDEVA